ncbi:MAG TPA: acyl carrier protein [Enhygromyxa sp.]|nr:acyl carrier protein [Enhygromyxa sp.]
MPAVRMTKGEVLDHVRRTIAELFELDLEDIRPESTIFDDLDLDSIDAIDLVAKLQQLTGERIEEQAMRSVRTVADLTELVAGQLVRTS